MNITLSEKFPVSINYCLSLGKMIDLGKFSYANPSINEEYFSVERRKEEDIEVQLLMPGLEPGEATSRNEILDAMKLRKVRPIFIEELIAFGTQYQDEQKKAVIVALGSVCEDTKDRRYVPMLSGNRVDRILDLHVLGSGFSWGCIFGVVPLIKQKKK